MHSCTIFGGKTRLSKKILPSILALARGSSGYYREPFMGGGSVLEAVCSSGVFEPGRLAAGDLHEDLVLMWKAGQLGWRPPMEVSERFYADLKRAAPSPLRGFVGIACSFAGKWFGGFARSPGHARCHAAEANRGFVRKCEAFRRSRVKLYQRSYEDWKFEPGDVVYLDPPYADTEGYDATGCEFDHARFWSWCHEQARRDVRLVVSESTAPPMEGWAQVWWVERQIEVTRQGGESVGQIFDALYVPEWLAECVGNYSSSDADASDVAGLLTA